MNFWSDLNSKFCWYMKINQRGCQNTKEDINDQITMLRNEQYNVFSSQQKDDSTEKSGQANT